MFTQLSRLTERAKTDKTARFLSVAHLLTSEALLEAFGGLRKDASAGVDEVTYAVYERAAWTKGMNPRFCAVTKRRSGPDAVMSGGPWQKRP